MTEANVEALNAIETALRKEDPHPIGSLLQAAPSSPRVARHVFKPIQPGHASGLAGAHSLDTMLKERGSVHGDFTDTASTAQTLKDVMKIARKWDKLRVEQREALEMIAAKIARILSGDPNHPDHWKDIQGYARLGEKSL